jgi:hypothetical protein
MLCLIFDPFLSEAVDCRGTATVGRAVGRISTRRGREQKMAEDC